MPDYNLRTYDTTVGTRLYLSGADDVLRRETVLNEPMRQIRQFGQILVDPAAVQRSSTVIVADPYSHAPHFEATFVHDRDAWVSGEHNTQPYQLQPTLVEHRHANGGRATSGPFSYTYDVFGRTRTATSGSTLIADFLYDAFGRRVQKRVLDLPTIELAALRLRYQSVLGLYRYVYGTNGEELIRDFHCSTPQVWHHWSVCNAGAFQLVSRIDAGLWDAEFVPYYPVLDAAGSAIGSFAPDANGVLRIVPLPEPENLGRLQMAWTTNPSSPIFPAREQFDQILHWQSQALLGGGIDFELALQHMGGRHFDPQTGSFISEPAVWGGSTKFENPFRVPPTNATPGTSIGLQDIANFALNPIAGAYGVASRVAGASPWLADTDAWVRENPAGALKQTAIAAASGVAGFIDGGIDGLLLGIPGFIARRAGFKEGYAPMAWAFGIDPTHPAYLAGNVAGSLTGSIVAGMFTAGLATGARAVMALEAGIAIADAAFSLAETGDVLPALLTAGGFGAGMAIHASSKGVQAAVCKIGNKLGGRFKCFTAGTPVWVLKAGLTMAAANAAMANGTDWRELAEMKPIEQVEIGDCAIGKPDVDAEGNHSDAGPLSLELVTRTFERETDELATLSVLDFETGARDDLQITPWHPIWLAGTSETGDAVPLVNLDGCELVGSSAYQTIDGNAASVANRSAADQARWLRATRGWVFPHDVKAGHVLSTPDGRRVVVTSVKLEQIRRKVYNLTVARTHTYVVGETQTWVHNACPWEELDNYRDTIRRTTGSDSPAVVARLEINGEKFFGRASRARMNTTQSQFDRVGLTPINPWGKVRPWIEKRNGKVFEQARQFSQHAEGHTFYKAWMKGGRNAPRGTMHIDIDMRKMRQGSREHTGPCSQCNFSIPEFMRRMNLRELQVHTRRTNTDGSIEFFFRQYQLATK